MWGSESPHLQAAGSCAPESFRLQTGGEPAFPTRLAALLCSLAAASSVEGLPKL